jgi:protein TonB
MAEVKKSSPKSEEIPAFFKDSFFRNDPSNKRKALAFPIAFFVHAIFVVTLVVIPLLSTSELPTIEVISAFLAPPVSAPPPPPPPPAKKRTSSVKTRIKPVQASAAVEPGRLVAPVEIPDQIQEETLSDIGVDGGVEGGVEGGVVGGVIGGVVGGVLGGAISSEIEAPVRAIGEIREPKLVKQVAPVYPEIARQARVEGTVIVEATTDIYGRVQNTKVLRSIPLLDQAAIDAVRQWVYEPMIINGRPRGVIFSVTVKFQLKN